ncbi:MAG: zf-HC2 domain-containing protein [Anaerolineae bacterium]|nr:zf-HC2 domain-containing protein [Anaerolineae bacterium]MDW8171494.1 zf-HC2 domain-containing protein [Anaerolineae bacterium]
MFNFKCRYTRARLNAFINRDLDLAARRLVGQHLDACDDCQVHYQRLRRSTHELERRLPQLGAPNKPRLNLIWTQIQQEIERPRPQEADEESLGWRSWLVLGALCLAMILPLWWQANNTMLAPLAQPAPLSAKVEETRVYLIHRRALHSYSTPSTPTASDHHLVAYLRNTPDPLLVRR